MTPKRYPTDCNGSRINRPAAPGSVRCTPLCAPMFFPHATARHGEWSRPVPWRLVSTHSPLYPFKVHLSKFIGFPLQPNFISKKGNEWLKKMFGAKNRSQCGEGGCSLVQLLIWLQNLLDVQPGTSQCSSYFTRSSSQNLSTWARRTLNWLTYKRFQFIIWGTRKLVDWEGLQ